MAGRLSAPYPGGDGEGRLLAADRGARRASGELEGEVLGVLHAADRPLVPADVQASLGDERAYTTVMTILSRLYAKGLVSRIPVGRAFAYFPVQSAAETVAGRMHTLLGIGADKAAVLAQFVDRLDPADEQLLEQLIESRNAAGGS